MKYNKNSAIEQLLKQFVGQTIKDDTYYYKIHELYGDCMEEFFFLMENIQTHGFFTKKASDMITIIPIDKI